MTTGASGFLRLPTPPSDYEQGFMARFINTLEIDKQLTYFAATNGLTNVADQTEATAWFMG